MAQRLKRRSWIWVLATVALGTVSFYSVKAIGRKPIKIDPDKIGTVQRMDLTRSVVATGKIQPVRQVEIKSKASGIIQSLPVNFGDFVRKGQIICELDRNDLLPRLNEARAALSVNQAQIETARADYEKYKVDAAGPDVQFLRRDRDRARQLFQQGLIASEKRDEAEKNYELAVNKQASAAANLQSAQAAIKKAQAQYDQQAAVVARSEEDLRNATIVSPIDGVVLSRDSEIGGAVSSILTMGSGATLIMTLGDLSEVYVKGKVDESDIGKVYLGQPARITVESFKDQKFAGKVTKISPMGTEKDNVTTFEVRVSISNESRKLRALMTANAEILLEERKGVLAIPEGAVLYAKDKSTEAEIPDAGNEKGRRRIPIKTGISNGARTQVIAGLTEGQKVLLP
ncbi:MAG: efflux RND transporter periplasmic adaptor subunit [Bryobacteraceae bacterium]